MKKECAVTDIVLAMKRLGGDWNYAINTMTSAGCDLDGYTAGLSKAENDLSRLVERIELNTLDDPFA